ncbi:MULTISPECIES: transcription antitermination factor NusB [Lacticaseibacillus]|uniref:Transcription antitermination protein NusB n=1 Tax=Lacticaseibacillus casei DSM 20011 = JCM 1134 = ATCC 393 TaxID=1423732 RepID=A0AAD1ET63_LACCA|nr:transcription antitermination factor NusB [Lacticaseibacillus casei]HAJ53555.1 transcription antitermination factor NusB [Lactobacillus sp.]MBI6596694.1 transcription antitermination factor NusB [Lacticaseibacillus casei]MBO1480327.1 transcription antitermination factor NusB [Lacticaseibacillus casei]MBO2415664.1 transcription antitermination factor NusB [Lacticaseibacillus casei]MCK2080023.1 transcription antitermination factor NusB [Lacticaseibacillus casei]
MESRHAIREAAFRALFALATNPEADKSAVYAEVLPKDTEVPPYLSELVEGVLTHQEALDAALTPQLKKGWTLSRLPKPDLMILRLGLYEIRYEEAMPEAAAINEAINLAKRYSDDQSAKFVNGILANFIEASPKA